MNLSHSDHLHDIDSGHELPINFDQSAESTYSAELKVHAQQLIDFELFGACVDDLSDHLQFLPRLIRAPDEFQYLLGENIDVVDIDHVEHENQPFSTSSLIKLSDLPFLPFRVQPTDLFEGKNTLIGIHHEFPSNRAFNVLNLLFFQKSDGDRGILDLNFVL